MLHRGRGAGSHDMIDMRQSRCPNLRKIQLKSAAQFTEANPCTNYPLICPVSPSCVVWKYNLEQHLTQKHPTSNKELYAHIYALHFDAARNEDEEKAMKAAFKAHV